MLPNGAAMFVTKEIIAKRNIMVMMATRLLLDFFVIVFLFMF